MKTRKEFAKYICPNGTVTDNGRIASLRRSSNLKECYIVRYADYTEVKTMPKLFIKPNGHKPLCIYFSA